MSDLSSYIQISANTVTTSNITTTGSNSVVSTTGNISAGNISTTGNITGNYILGNGSQLTGIAARSSNTAVTVTGNAQSNITSVGTLTSLTSSGLISTTGNIVGNNINGNINTGNITSTANINLNAVNAVDVTQSLFRLASFTTSQAANLTPINGDMIFNSTLGNVQIYNGTKWGNIVLS